jgi:predicted nuclease of restriction endonuclease-like (RecB) superfamily
LHFCNIGKEDTKAAAGTLSAMNRLPAFSWQRPIQARHQSARPATIELGMTLRKSVKQTDAVVVPAQKPTALLADLRGLIQQARVGVARAVDSSLTALYWHVGQRIRQDILKEKRAEYGEQIVATLGTQLETEFGRGFGEKNLRRMIRFAEVFPDREIVASLSRQLAWSHFIELIPLEKPLEREFYAEMCRVERWSVRTLRQKIGSMLFERTALSRKPEKLAALELKQLREEDKVTPDLVFRDPYILDFLGLKDTYAEKDLEAAILREIEAFLLELGVGFCFVARQQRMQIDDRDYYLDLLFYHRKLRRLIAIDLKLGKFEAADKGQMELYLGWLKRYACEPEEAEPLGMILCAGKSEEHIALLELQKSGIHVASYWTDALPKKELERKLHDAVRLARARLETAKD